jgi:predicted GIY-YIG superfamily endonuclease
MTAAVPGPGTVYLIHFDRRYKHAGHYLGWTSDLAARLAEHARGQGARLMAVIRDAGITWQLARTWPGTRRRERQLKKRGGASRFCPLCGVRPRPGPDVDAAPPAAVRTWMFPVPPVQVAPYDRGAAAARSVIGGQLAAGQPPARIAAVQAAMFADYDPATARAAARQWHRGYQDTAAVLLAGTTPPGAALTAGAAR